MSLTTGLQLPFGIQPVNPVPVDSWSGPYSASTEADALTLANTSIPSAIRFTSMEVRIIVGTTARKYWYRDGIADGNLVEFTSGGGGSSYGSEFTVTTIGTNAYSGTSVPTITGYSTSAIYLTQFSNTNTTTGTTLDIDGFGPLDLMKGTDTGLDTLDINEIQTGVTYFLTYDGTQLQFFTSSPAGTPDTYTNLNPATTTVGGVLAGTVFSGATWQSIFDTMFHPTLVPAFTTFQMRTYGFTGTTQSQVLEVGNSVSGGTRVFTWATSNSTFVNPNSIKIYNVTSGNVIISTPASGMTNDWIESITGLTNVQKTAQAAHTWRVWGTRTNNSSFYLDYSVGWYWRRMYGVSTATTITTSAGVNAFSGSGVLTTVMAGTYVMNGAGYKYFFVPGTFAHPTLIKDQNTQLAVAMADASDNPFFSGATGTYRYGTVTVTNIYGIPLNYRVYRTRNLLNGNITITVT